MHDTTRLTYVNRLFARALLVLLKNVTFPPPAMAKKHARLRVDRTAVRTHHDALREAKKCIAELEKLLENDKL